MNHPAKTTLKGTDRRLVRPANSLRVFAVARQYVNSGPGCARCEGGYPGAAYRAASCPLRLVGTYPKASGRAGEKDAAARFQNVRPVANKSDR
jgi:hypothetical protein